MSPAVVPVTLVKRRVKALQTHLPAALDGDARALHRARVASRRLREVLPLVSSKSSGTRKRVRRLTRWLGRVREMDVALALLEADTWLQSVPAPALSEARQHVHGAREKRRARLLRRLQKVNPKKLERMVARLVADSVGENAEAWRRLLAVRLARRATALRRATVEAGSIYVPERLHGVRLASKKLRYALEIAAELGTRDAAKLAATVRKVQVLLGDLQDRHILLREVREAASGASDEATRNGLATLAGSLESACRELHGEFLKQRGALTSALVAIRQDIIPELARTARARRPVRAMTHGGSDRAVPDTARRRRTPRRGLA